MVKVGDKIRILFDGADHAKVMRGDEFVVCEVFGDGGVLVDGEYNWLFSSYSYEVIHATPPEKITQNGYEYSLVGPVKPEWLVDGAWVVGKIYGDLYQVIEGENNNFSFRDSHGRLEVKKISTIVNYYRPHEPKDWKWGDWAMYAGRKVFVIEKGNWMGDIRVSHPDLLDGVTCVSVLSLTPTF